MSIELVNESVYSIDEAAIVRLCTYCLDALRIHPNADISVLLVDEGAMEQLHVQWLGEPGPTDVLSFPMEELRPGTDEAITAEGILGDIVLCPQVAESQAEQAGHSMLDELLLLTTHGILHLLGFDHAEADEEKEMFALQKDLLIGFAAAERLRGAQ